MCDLGADNDNLAGEPDISTGEGDVSTREPDAFALEPDVPTSGPTTASRTNVLSSAAAATPVNMTSDGGLNVASRLPVPASPRNAFRTGVPPLLVPMSVSAT